MSEPPPGHNLVARYLAPVAATVLVIALCAALAPALNDDVPLLLFVIAVAASAWYGGFIPGLAATLLSAFAGGYFFIERSGSYIHNRSDSLRIVLFVLLGLFLSFLIEELHRRRRNLNERHQELTNAQRKLAGQARLLGFSHALGRNLEDRIVFWNDGAERLYGWTKEEAEGQLSHVLLRTRFSRPRADIERDLIAAGEWQGELTHRRKDGSEIVVASHWVLERDEQGNPLCVLETSNDITRLKRTEESFRLSEERLRLGAEIASLGLWELDLATLEITCTEQCKINFGQPPDRPLPYPAMFEAILPGDRERVRSAINEAIAHKSVYDVEYAIRLPDGGARWIGSRGRASYDEDGTPLTMTGVTRDITQRREVEEALCETDRRKDEFLATLAHELRNSLAPIGNALAVWPRIEDEKQMRELREIMARQIEQITRLIDDLLDVSHIELGKIALRRERVDLRTVIDAAVEAITPLVERQAQRLTVGVPQSPLLARVDIARMTQIFGNLLNNAVKHTEAGGEIALTLERVGGEAVITVRDNGAGIPPHMLPRIFDMLMQADPALEGGREGLGIGLTLVKNLVELHGGSIGARSDGVNKGSEFIVRLPALASEAKSAAAPADAQDARPVARKILVVDDVEASAQTLALLLEAYGHIVDIRFDGPSAIEAARTSPPDVAFIDIAMPGMSGYEVARRLRREPNLGALTLVALTGFGREEDRVCALEAGFDRHLVKPTSLEAIREALECSAAAAS